MSETFENTPITELSIEGLGKAIELAQRKFEDALLEVEQYPDGESREKAIEDAVRHSEALIEMKKLIGDRKREANARRAEGGEGRLDDPNFPSNKHQGIL
jgi:hypothetical protein